MAVADRTPRETLVFLVSAAAVVLHVLVDAFVAPEPGVARTDHLVSAAVPIALVVAAALLLPRVRAGAQACLALVLGVLALTGAGIAVAHAAARGPGGDDWTGFLLLPAGLALCGLGAWLLWRSRKPGRLRYLRRALVAVAAAVVAYVVVFPIAVGIVITHRPRAAVEPADLGQPYEEVRVTTGDGLGLAGWYVPSENGAAVLVFPGRSGTVDHARMLAGHGYGVLLLDMRGQGESEGDPNALGWSSRADVDAAVAWLARRPDVEDGRIGGLGLSVGGELLLEAAAGNPGLLAVVSEGAGERSLREGLLRGPAGWPALPSLTVFAATIAGLSGETPPPSLGDLVGRISPRPILLVYTPNGQGGEDLNPEYYERAGEPKTLWEIPESGHVGGLDARPEEYERRIVAFFDEALGTGG